MFKFREHRGSLEASMETVKEFDSREELLEHIKELHPSVKSIEPISKHYCYDDRIDWNTYIVIIEGYGPIGFTDRLVI